MKPLDQLEQFQQSNAYKNQDLRCKLCFGSEIDKAYFLYLHAMEFSWEFMLDIKLNFIFKDPAQFKIKANLKQNLTQIGKKIQDLGDNG